VSPEGFGSDLAAGALAWALTYLVHSTLILGLAWIAGAALGERRARLRELLWRLALVVPIVTSGVQTGARSLGLIAEPWLGDFLIELPSASALQRAEPARSASSEPSPAPGAAELAGARDAGFGASEPRTALGAPARAGAAGLGQSPAPPSAEPSELPARERAAEAAGTAAATEPEAALWAAGTAPTPASPVAERMPSPARSPTRSPVAALPWPSLALATWVLAAAAGLLGLARAARALDRRLGSRVPITAGPLPGALASLARRARLARAPLLTCSPALAAPLAVGWRRPEICLPLRALTDLTRDEQQAMLAHELAHLARRDPVWLLAARSLERLFFFQPLNRLARRELQDLSEILCDEWSITATGRDLALASCLAEVAQWIVDPRLPRRELALAVPMAAHGSRLRRRVSRILDAGQRDAGTGAWLALPVCAALGGGLVLAAPGFVAASGATPSRPSWPSWSSATPAAPTVDALQESRAAAPAGSASLPAVAASVTGALELDLELLGAELDQLDVELAGLRGELEGDRRSEGAARQLQRLEQRAEALREKSMRTGVLLERARDLIGDDPSAPRP
jgi:Zn-dependent protease with chaperone function